MTMGPEPGKPGAGVTPEPPPSTPATDFTDEVAQWRAAHGLGAGSTGGRKPMEPGRATEQEQEEEILLAAAHAQGIVFASLKEFRAFEQELHGSFVEAQVTRTFPGTWTDYVNQLARRRLEQPEASAQRATAAVEGGVAPTFHPSGLERSLDSWRQNQEQARIAAQEAKSQREAQGKLQSQYEKVQKLQEAEFKDTLGELKARYPKLKNVINALEPYAFQAWQDAQAGAQQPGVLAAGAPELEGMAGPTTIGAGAFARTLDWGAFADSQGLGDQWQEGMFRQAFDNQIATPLRAAAKTPAAKIAVEDQIAKLEATAAPALKTSFAQARDNVPTLDYNAYLASDEAKGIMGEAMRASQNRIQPGQAQKFAQGRLQEQEAAYQMAFQGYDPAYIAARLNITENDARNLSQAGAALRQWQVGNATQLIPGYATGVRPDDAARMAAQGTAALGARDAALNAIPGYAEAARAANIRESRAFTEQAQRQAYASDLGSLKKQALDLYFALYGSSLEGPATNPDGTPNYTRNVRVPTGGIFASNNPQELQDYIRQMQPLVQRKQLLPGSDRYNNPGDEAYRRRDQMLADTGFRPMLEDAGAAFTRQTAGTGIGPVSLEDYTLGRVDDLWKQYQQWQNQEVSSYQRTPEGLVPIKTKPNLASGGAAASVAQTAADQRKKAASAPPDIQFDPSTFEALNS